MKRTVQRLGIVNNLNCQVGPLVFVTFSFQRFPVPLFFLRDGKSRQNNPWCLCLRCRLFVPLRCLILKAKNLTMNNRN